MDLVNRDLKSAQEQTQYKNGCYTVGELSGDVVRMETGLPTKEVFQIVVRYALRFKDSIIYFAGWTAESISFEDQIFITLMKVKQNYTKLHLAQLYNCSVATIANIISTFIHVLHAILFKDIMTSIPLRDKNKLSATASFDQYGSCQIVIDSTDIEVAAPGLISQQNAIYSSYRGMNSSKVLACWCCTKCSHHICKQALLSFYFRQSHCPRVRPSQSLNSWGYDTCRQGISYSGYCTTRGFSKHPTVPE